MSRALRISKKFSGLVRDQRGAGMTEYIILVGVIAILAVAAFKLFGEQVKAKIEGQTSTVESTVNTEPE